MDYRIEHDSMGEMKVPADKYWGAQTQRSYQKKAAAMANYRLEKLNKEKLDAINAAADEILEGKLDDNFPLVVWQTGSGTQSNMNVNEVIANRGNAIVGKMLLHPNDDVNKSQSSNDTFPTAMHIAAVFEIRQKLIPSIESMIGTLKRLEKENEGIIKSGRTHLQDATPISFSQEINGWRNMLEISLEQIEAAIPGISKLALGGTAVGTGLNAPKGFAEEAAKAVSELTGYSFETAVNKFHNYYTR